MAGGDDVLKKTVWSQPPTYESTFDAGTLTLDLVEDILCKLPVKLLMQLRCVCKSWNSLISNPIFAKKHFHLTRTLSSHHHLISIPEDRRLHLWDSLLPSFSNSATSTSSIPKTRISFPLNLQKGYYQLIGSCDGILCFSIGIHNDSVMVWNPSINKFKILPPLESQPELEPEGVVQTGSTKYGFGYDPLTHNYKVVAFYCYRVDTLYKVCKKVEVHTLGTDIWKTIKGLPYFPFGFGFTCTERGIYLSGTINWLGSLFGIDSSPRLCQWVIFSFDLGNESYKELLPPDLGRLRVVQMNLGMLRDCLCILALDRTKVIHLWLMEDYGNNDSWTKLFAIVSYDKPLIGRNFTSVCPLYILEDGKLLLDFKVMRIVVYDSTNGTIQTLKVPSISGDCLYYNHVYIESLISP